MARLQFRFTFVDTEEQAVKMCNQINSTANAYRRKNKPAHYTPWSSQDGREHCFVVLYWD